MRYGPLLVGLTLVASIGIVAVPGGARAADVDISGRWVGVWKGVGVANIGRMESAGAEFSQDGRGGRGRVRISGSNAAEVPTALTAAGDLGVPVFFDIKGSKIRIEHELGARYVAAEFRLDGDVMIGRLLNSPAPVQIKLTRVGSPGRTRGEQRLVDVEKELAQERDRADMLRAQVDEARALAEQARAAAEMATAAARDASSTAGVADAKATEALAKAGDTRGIGSSPEGAGTGVTPPVPSAVAEHRREHVATLEVGFGFDKWELDGKAEKLLTEIVEKLKTNPMLMADLEGYTDSIGTRVYNLGLSQRRVNSVHRYLVEKGVPLTQIHVVGLGPIPGPGSRDEQANKRRVTVKIMSLGN
ncbi:MAG TPA: OmpA family protein [Methylomirabilota bacterium]|jgi:outer membrane protein OmpA-like peptidoglycan-associated protein